MDSCHDYWPVTKAVIKSIKYHFKNMIDFKYDVSTYKKLLFCKTP